MEDYRREFWTLNSSLTIFHFKTALFFFIFEISKSWHTNFPPLFVAKCHVMNVVCELAEDISRKKERNNGGLTKQLRVSSFEQLVRRWKQWTQFTHFLSSREVFGTHFWWIDGQLRFFFASTKNSTKNCFFNFFSSSAHVAGCLWGKRGYQTMAVLMNFVLFLIANSYTILMGKYWFVCEFGVKWIGNVLLFWKLNSATKFLSSPYISRLAKHIELQRNMILHCF